MKTAIGTDNDISTGSKKRCPQVEEKTLPK
jgi:hypothetical protein